MMDGSLDAVWLVAGLLGVQLDVADAERSCVAIVARDIAAFRVRERRRRRPGSDQGQERRLDRFIAVVGRLCGYQP